MNPLAIAILVTVGVLGSVLAWLMMREWDFEPAQAVLWLWVAGIAIIETWLAYNWQSNTLEWQLIYRKHIEKCPQTLQSQRHTWNQPQSWSPKIYSAGPIRLGSMSCVHEFASPVPEEQRRYSPAQLVMAYKTAIVGAPNPALVCTSYIERANLTMRTHCKRLARLTLAFSKKLANFKAAIALNVAYYNLVKTHSTLRCTPAMAAGVESSHWTVADLIEATGQNSPHVA